METLNTHLIYASGGALEGMVLWLPVFPTGHAFAFRSRAIWHPQTYVIGEKTESPCTAYSLLSASTRQGLPRFLYTNTHDMSALVGAHHHDLTQLECSGLSPFVVAKAEGLLMLDFLGWAFPPPGMADGPKGIHNIVMAERRMTVETKDGERTLTVAEDWQNMMRQYFPFRVRSWNDVLDMIQEG